MPIHYIPEPGFYEVHSFAAPIKVDLVTYRRQQCKDLMIKLIDRGLRGYVDKCLKIASTGAASKLPEVDDDDIPDLFGMLTGVALALGIEVA